MEDGVETQKESSSTTEPVFSGSGWLYFGWAIFVVGLLLALAGSRKMGEKIVDLDTYRLISDPNAFLYLWAGGGIASFGLLIACIGNVASELKKIRNKIGK